MGCLRNMKSTKLEIIKRVEEVLAIRLQGAQFHDIVQYAAEQDPPWNLSERQLWEYVHKGNELLKRQLETDRAGLINRHLAQRRTIYAKAMQGGDYRAALSALESECKLLGLPGGTETGGNTTNVNIAIVAPEHRAAKLLEVIDAELTERGTVNGNGSAHTNGNGKPHLNGEANGHP